MTEIQQENPVKKLEDAARELLQPGTDFSSVVDPEKFDSAFTEASQLPLNRPITDRATISQILSELSLSKEFGLPIQEQPQSVTLVALTQGGSNYPGPIDYRESYNRLGAILVTTVAPTSGKKEATLFVKSWDEEGSDQA